MITISTLVTSISFHKPCSKFFLDKFTAQACLIHIEKQVDFSCLLLYISMSFLSIFMQLQIWSTSMMLYVVSSGLGFLQFCKLNSFRTKLILGFSLFMGCSIQQYVREYRISTRQSPIQTNSGPVHILCFFLLLPVIYIHNGLLILFLHWTQFNDIMTSTTIAAMIALLLDSTLALGKDGSSNDGGLHWWRKFNSYNWDVRSGEFYALPFKLSKLSQLIEKLDSKDLQL